MQQIQVIAFDVNQLRERLQKLTDDELRKFGRAAAHMVSPKANMGQPPGETFVLQLADSCRMGKKTSEKADDNLSEI
jgi:hypothetical protein